MAAQQRCSMWKRILLILMALSACNPESDPVAFTLELSDLSVSEGELTADTTQVSLISVRLSPPPEFEPKRVKFNTTIGKFIESGSGDTSVLVASDGSATVALRHPEHPGTGLVSATIGAKRITQELRFVYDPSIEFEALTGPDGAPADGTTVLTYVATIATGARSYTPRVKFTSSAGTFVGGSQNGGISEIEVAVNDRGQATAHLKAPSTPATGAVIAKASRSSLTRAVSFHRPTLSFDTITSTVPADGVTVLPIRVHVPAVAPGTIVRFRATGAAVLVNANNGVFEQPVGTDGRAVAAVRATAPGTGTVTADVGGAAASRHIEFVRAYPDFIRITASKLTVRARETIQFTIELGRYVGEATAGSVVTLEATAPGGQTIGLITHSTVIPASGKATIEYSPGSTSYLGLVMIRARTTGTNGSIAADLTIEIVNQEEP